jgi:hypothetical protein
MIWATRKCTTSEYKQYVQLLQKLLSTYGPQYDNEFVFVSKASGDPQLTECYVGVSALTHLTGFDGFNTIAESGLPKQVDSIDVCCNAKKIEDLFRLRNG